MGALKLGSLPTPETKRNNSVHVSVLLAPLAAPRADRSRNHPAERPGERLGERPRPYYGWVLVWTLGVTETVSWGILNYAFGVFLAPMERDLGWSRATLSGAFSLALLLSG